MKLTEITETNPDWPIALDIIRKALADGKKVTFESPIEIVARGKGSTQARHRLMTGDVVRLELTKKRTGGMRVDMFYHETTEGFADKDAVTEVSNAEFEDCDIEVTGNHMHIKLPNYQDK
jgi:translation initiation factor IF-1